MTGETRSMQPTTPEQQGEAPRAEWSNGYWYLHNRAAIEKMGFDVPQDVTQVIVDGEKGDVFYWTKDEQGNNIKVELNPLPTETIEKEGGLSRQVLDQDSYNKLNSMNDMRRSSGQGPSKEKAPEMTPVDVTPSKEILEAARAFLEQPGFREAIEEILAKERKDTDALIEQYRKDFNALFKKLHDRLTPLEEDFVEREKDAAAEDERYYRR